VLFYRGKISGGRGIRELTACPPPPCGELSQALPLPVGNAAICQPAGLSSQGRVYVKKHSEIRGGTRWAWTRSARPFGRSWWITPELRWLGAYQIGRGGTLMMMHIRRTQLAANTAPHRLPRQPAEFTQPPPEVRRDCRTDVTTSRHGPSWRSPPAQVRRAEAEHWMSAVNYEQMSLEREHLPGKKNNPGQPLLNCSCCAGF